MWIAGGYELYRRKSCAQEINVLRCTHETHVPAKKAQTRTHARLFEARRHEKWTQFADAQTP